MSQIQRHIGELAMQAAGDGEQMLTDIQFGLTAEDRAEHGDPRPLSAEQRESAFRAAQEESDRGFGITAEDRRKYG